MTLEGLWCFCAILDSGSFRAAAVQVHRSQPAVSQQLKSLEAELGHPLIERSTCRPTPVGQLLYARARKILLEVETLSREVLDFAEGGSGELHVGTSDTTALYVLPPHVRRFAERLPGTRLVIVNRSSDAIVDQVRQGDLDIGIVSLPVDQPDIEEHPLFEQRLVLVVPKEHRFAGRNRVELKSLSEEPLLMLERTTRTGALLRDFLQLEDFTPRTLLDSGSFEVIKRYIDAGVGLSFLPESVVTPSDEGLSCVAVRGLPTVMIGAIWRRAAYRSKASKVFLELVSEGSSIK